MPLEHILKNSSQSGKEPTAGQLDYGEISLNFHEDGPFICCKDTSGAVRRIAGIWVNSTAPATPTPGVWWLDTSVSPAQVKVYESAAAGWLIVGMSAATAAATGVVRLADAAAITAGTAGRVVDAAQLSAATPDASTTAKGLVQLADAAAVMAGTAGRMVDAAQLKSAQAAASGSATAPTTPTAGQVWVDSSVTPAVIKVWNGTTWVAQAGATISSATAPAAPATGQLWIDTSTTPNVTKIWDGTAWVTATPDGAAVAAIANDAKYATKTELATENPWDRTGTHLAPHTAGDVVTVSAGTAALPGLTPVGDPNTGIYSPGADQLGISTNGAERARIDSSGRFLVGTSTANASGAKLQTSDGLTFPATAVASADPNTLDDYEEGTFTPVVGGNATDGTATYALQNGTYTKVGRMVTIHANLSWSSCTATGNMRLRGLPFTAAASHAASVNFGYQENITLAAFAILNGFVNPSQTFIIPQSTVTGGATSTEIAVDAAAVIYFSATYFVS